MIGYEAICGTGGIAIEGPNEDDAYELSKQREIDEAHEVELAFFEGKEAGRRGTAAALNRYELGTPQATAWERGRSSVEGEQRNHRRTA